MAALLTWNRSKFFVKSGAVADLSKIENNEASATAFTESPVETSTQPPKEVDVEEVPSDDLVRLAPASS